MSPWVSCSLEEEILAISEVEPLFTVRYLCALIYPWLSWESAQVHAAEVVRQHCLILVRERCLDEVPPGVFRRACGGRA